MRCIFMFFMALSSLAFSNNAEKTYVRPDQISVAENQIFIHIDHQWVPITSLHADTGGIYTTDNIRDIFHWICPKCGYENGLFDKRCQNCGY